MRFIPTRVHGMMDYAMGLLLIAAPWLLGFSHIGAAMIWPVALGAGVIFYSLLTRYELGVAGLIDMRAHLTMDMVGGLLLAASPWLGRFAHEVWAPHVDFGLLEVGAALMTQTRPADLPSHVRNV